MPLPIGSSGAIELAAGSSGLSLDRMITTVRRVEGEDAESSKRSDRPADGVLTPAQRWFARFTGRHVGIPLLLIVGVAIAYEILAAMTGAALLGR